MKAAVISMGSISSKWVAEALEKHFDEVDHLDIKEFEVNLGKEGGVLYSGKPLKQYDCIYMKGSGRYANLLRSIASMKSSSSLLPHSVCPLVCSSSSVRCRMGSFSSEYAFAISMPAQNGSKRSTSPLCFSSRHGLHNGVLSAG